MSSIRIAARSCALVVALAAGTVGAVSAFPLHGPLAAAPHASQAQTPPRDPLTPAQHHRLAQQYWEKANKDLSLTPEEKLEVVLKGIAAEDRALAIDPDYPPAVMYKSLLVRMQARLTADPGVQSKLITQADELRDKAQALTGASKASPSSAMPSQAPPDNRVERRESEMQFTPESFERHMQELKPLRIGGAIKPPLKIKDVKPVYPQIAQDSHVQGVVIIEAIIDEAGRVADARILRSIPLLDQAALEAVQQWEFRPFHVNGAPQPVVMTLTVNFYLQ